MKLISISPMDVCMRSPALIGFKTSRRRKLCLSGLFLASSALAGPNTVVINWEVLSVNIDFLLSALLLKTSGTDTFALSSSSLPASNEERKLDLSTIDIREERREHNDIL